MPSPPLPPSLYAATARPAPPTPPLRGDAAADVAIVGAGFTGLSTALHLAEAGARVAVLDRGEPGWGASGRNGGQLNPGLKTDPSQVIKDFGEERGRRLVDLAWGAPETTLALIRRLGIECDARQGGTLRAALRPGHAAALRASAEDGQRHGMPVTLLDRDAAAALTGTHRHLAAMRDPRGGDVQPLDLARGLARAVLAAGGAVHGDTAVTALRREEGRWVLDTPQGRLTADAVVLATNGYTDDLWPGLRRSLVPVFSAIVASEPLRQDLAAQVMPSRAVLYESGHITCYLRVDARGRLLMGGRGPQGPMAGPDAVGYLMRYAETLWPLAKDLRWSHGWNGQLAITPDHYPHLHRPAPGLIACLGYNGRGVALSTTLGAEVARLALGAREEEIALPVSPIRPMRLHRFWRLGVLAKVAEGRVRDRLGL